MVLIPYPQKLVRKTGAFHMTKDVSILLDISCDYDDFEAALALQREINKMTGFNPSIIKGDSWSLQNKAGSKTGLIILKKDHINPKSQAYKLSVREGSIEITGDSASGLFYGIQTLRQLFRNHPPSIPCLEIDDYPAFENRGFYHDVTRGRVPTLETLKELADRLSFYKINQLQLYIEHSFAFSKHSEIWVDSDPITAEEILVLDEYCRKRRIELVPSLSTFGHLYHALVSKSFRHLNEFEKIPEETFILVDRMRHYTLDACNPLSLQFVYEMIEEFMPLFSSDKFNICCDETFDLGQGRNKALVEEVGAGKLYLYFTKKIIEYVKSRKKHVMMWGDILLKHPELMKDIPEDVTILNWDYSPDVTEEGVGTVAGTGLVQYVCPGVQGWNKLINDMDAADKNISASVAHAKKYNAAGILNTDWGDFGHVNHLSASMPGAILGAGLSWNADAAQKPSDEAISKLEYGDASGRITELLRELSRQSFLDWETAVLWYYTACGLDPKTYGYNGFFVNRMMGTDENRIRSAFNRVRELEREISALHGSVYEERRADIKEFLVSGDGIALFNALLLVIKKKFLGQTGPGLIFNPEELAEKLEYWFAGYKSVWRARNKESELFRIKEVVMGICRLLRD